MTFKALISSAILLTLSSCLATAITVTLNPVVIKVGATATVPCTFELEGSPDVTFRWYAQAKGSQVRQRVYAVDQSDPKLSGQDLNFKRNLTANADGSLIIPDVTAEDNNVFATLVCQVDAGSVEGEASTTFMAVVLPATPPTVISAQTDFEMGEGKVIGTCTSGFGYPSPTVVFKKGDVAANPVDELDDLTAFKTNQIKTTGPDGISMSVEDTLVATLGSEDDGRIFSCEITSGVGSVTSVQTGNFPAIHVKYPTDTVNIVADAGPRVKVGDVVTLTCSANGYPVGDISKFGDGTTSPIQVTVAKSDNGRVVPCSASNTGNTAAITTSYTFAVDYLDAPVVDSETFITLGSDLALSCTAEGNPPAAVSWTKDGASVSDNGELAITAVGFDAAGTYVCTAVSGDLSESSSSNVVVKGLTATTDNVVYTVGDLENLESVPMICSATGVPAPAITWTKTGGPEGDEAMPDPVVTTDGAAVTSTLTVIKADTLSLTNYQCDIDNGGADKYTRTFSFPEMKSGSSIGIIIGILIAVLLLGIILFVLYKKGIICKNGKGAEDADDIAVDMTKEGGDVEQGVGGEEAAPEEKEKLVNGSEDKKE